MAFRIVIGDVTIGIQGQDFAYIFSVGMGGMESLYKDGKDIILEIMHSIDNALHKLYNDNINRLESRWIYGKCIN